MILLLLRQIQKRKYLSTPQRIKPITTIPKMPHLFGLPIKVHLLKNKKSMERETAGKNLLQCITELNPIRRLD